MGLNTGLLEPTARQAHHIHSSANPHTFYVQNLLTDSVTAVSSECFCVNLVRVHTVQEPGQINHYGEWLLIPCREGDSSPRHSVHTGLGAARPPIQWVPT
jgi:hypothetical protein